MVGYVWFGLVWFGRFGLAGLVWKVWISIVNVVGYMSQLLLLGKVEYGGGPIFKVVLEC